MPNDQFHVTWWMLDDSQDPPCVRRTWETITADSQQDADDYATEQSENHRQRTEQLVQSGTRPEFCDTPEGDPGTPDIPARTLHDTAVQAIPMAEPSISGGKAITGLRSWLDLGRPTGIDTTATLDFEGLQVSVGITATVTARIDWGDGTVTTHTSRGGPYRQGEPGPDDIVHTYTHAQDDTVLTVTDTWDITVSLPGDDITLTWQAPPATLTFDVDQVRSARDR